MKIITFLLFVSALACAQIDTGGGGGGGGTTSSVGLTVNSTSPSGIYTVTGSPVTTTGSLNIDLAGTSGGIPYFSDTTTLTSSGALTASRLVLGGGAGASPTVLGSLGTTTTLLHGNAAGAPTFATVTEADQTLADNTTNNATTSAHGYLLKLNNSATQFMNGQGAWATPAGSGATPALDNLVSVNINTALLGTSGASGAPAYSFTSSTGTGMWQTGGVLVLSTSGGSTIFRNGATNQLTVFTATLQPATDNTQALGDSTHHFTKLFLTTCANSGGTCSAAPTGFVSIAAAATTVTVATTAVTAASQILVQEDSSLGTALSVTCNTTIARTYAVTARTAGTSFVITTSAAPITNPACLSYSIVN